MTGKSAEETGCPACGISVYPAEAQMAANRLWHKRCFKCCDCSHLLSAHSCHVLKGRLYCKHCLVEATRAAPPMLYTDTTKIQPEDQHFGCPRCGGAVFKAEEVVEKGRIYHKKCFTCIKCHRPQDDKLQVFVGFDSQIYCKTCYPKIWHTPLPLNPESFTKLRAQQGDPNACKRCFGLVFEAEKMVSSGSVYHQKCFNCVSCRKYLDYTTFLEHKGDIYCKSCYVDSFGYRSKSVGPTEAATAAAVPREPRNYWNCPGCKGTVSEADKVVTSRHFFHRHCLACKQCHSQLDPSSYLEEANGDIYCKNCYAALFGSASRAKSVGLMDTDGPERRTRCPRCFGKVYEAEKMVSSSGWFHRACFRCYLCDRLLDQTNHNNGPNGGIYCRSCYKHIYESIVSQPMAYAKSVVETTKLLANRGSGEDACRRCQGLVFEAERMAMRSGSYHKRCFTCLTCKRALDYLSAVDGPQGKEVFCQSCYVKQFGPTELKVANKKVLDTRAIRPEDSKLGCPRCQGAVYHAEMVLAKGRAYHRSCAICHTCSSRLDSLSLNTGPDNNIYCKACLDHHFGSHHGHSYSVPDITKIKNVSDDRERCHTCRAKVFDRERIVSPRGKLVFHRECFRCEICSKKLDGTNSDTNQVYPFEVKLNNDAKLVCRRCYQENFEAQSARNYFMDFNALKSLMSDQNDPEACLKCLGKVFEAEKVLTRNGLIHTNCLSCFECHRKLGPSSFSEASDGRIYCPGCYSVKYGMRVRSRSLGPPDYSKLRADDKDPNKCLRCQGKIFHAEMKSTAFGWFHSSCFRCFSCNISLETAGDNLKKRSDGKVVCKQCAENEISLHRESGYPDIISHTCKSYVESDAIKAAANDPDRCPRCSGKVFSAEMICMKNGKFHRKCFTCCDCKRALDFATACDGPNGDIFCQSCYTKFFGAIALYYQIEDNSRKTHLIKPGDGTGCPRCSGAVYEAEKLSCNGKQYHIRCATCSTCSVRLDASTIYGASDGDIYCQGCYCRKFGGPGYRGTLCSQWIDEKASESLRPSSFSSTNQLAKMRQSNDDLDSCCNRCQGKVFDLEKITSKSGIWHRQCFTCFNCHTTLASTLADGHESADGQVYCKACFVKTFVETNPPMIFYDTKRIAPGAGEKGCARCQGVVFEREKVVIGGQWFHQNCLKCHQCKATLDVSRAMVGFNGQVLCCTCHKIQLEESSRPSTAMVTIAAEAGDPTACPRCQGKVFEAEKMMSKSRWFHRKCFTCKMCMHSLDYTSVMDGPNSEIYCKTCYVREYFTGGRNKFCDQVKSSESNPEETCKRCKCKVFEVDKVYCSSLLYHKSCLFCADCSRQLESTNLYEARDGCIYCKNCYDTRFGVFGRGSSVGRPSGSSNAISGSSGLDHQLCPKCRQAVYEAEKVVTSAGVFHHNCLFCKKCSRQLDVLSLFATTKCDIYCKNCYCEEFGAASRKMSQSMDSNDPVALALIGTTSILASDSDPNQCPACLGKVFEAEKMQTSRGIFHRKCFKCLLCKRALDASLVCNGFQAGHIFCQNCYMKSFGPSALRQEGAWKSQPMTNVDPSKACPRCLQPVFANEELYSNGRSYHKMCARCKSCSRQLDFNTVYDGKDKEIYCRGCYGKHFGLHGYGYGGFGSLPALTAGGNEVKMEYHFTQFF